jgi:WhiB family redox-sensing transcriptional regulator
MSADSYAWMTDALCAQADPEQWTSGAVGNQQTPKRICARCPVKPECIAHATALHTYDGAAMHGIWGGHGKRKREAARGQMGEAA